MNICNTLYCVSKQDYDKLLVRVLLFQYYISHSKTYLNAKENEMIRMII